MSVLTKDIIERAFWTALQAFVAVYAVGGVGGSAAAKAGAIAAVAAGISVIKGAFASKIGNPDSASSVPSI
jgi:hypothetical protein